MVRHKERSLTKVFDLAFSPKSRLLAVARECSFLDPYRVYYQRPDKKLGSPPALLFSLWNSSSASILKEHFLAFCRVVVYYQLTICHSVTHAEHTSLQAPGLVLVQAVRFSPDSRFVAARATEMKCDSSEGMI